MGLNVNYLFIILLNISFLWAKSFTSYQVIEVGGLKDFDSEETLLSTLGLPLNEEGIEILHEDATHGSVQILVKPELKDKLLHGVKINQLEAHIVIDDVGALIEHSNSFRSEIFDLKGEGTFERYMTYNEISSYLRTMAMKFPHKVSLRSIGKSFNDISIPMITITEQIRRSTTKPKPVIFVEAGAHAREWISISTALYLIDQLARTTSLTKDVEWRIVPVSNPDGYKHTWSKDRLWRKNRKTFSDSPCIGVDLNRNFDSFWGKAGTSKRVCSTVFAGTEPFSEPEARAIRDAVLEVQNRTKVYVSFHNYGQLILYPPGGNFHKLAPLTDSVLDTLGKKMATAIFEQTKTEYTVGSPAKMLYPASGLSMDWALLQAKIPISFTFELRDNGAMGFLLPETEIQETVNEVWSAMKILYLEAKKIKPNLLRDSLSKNQIWDIRELTNDLQEIESENSLFDSKRNESLPNEVTISDHFIIQILRNNGSTRNSNSSEAMSASSTQAVPIQDFTTKPESLLISNYFSTVDSLDKIEDESNSKDIFGNRYRN